MTPLVSRRSDQITLLVVVRLQRHANIYILYPAEQEEEFSARQLSGRSPISRLARHSIKATATEVSYQIFPNLVQSPAPTLSPPPLFWPDSEPRQRHDY